MSTATFGAPTQEAAPDLETVNGSASHEDAAETINLDDPRLQTESLEVNPEGDAYAIQPPVPDGFYRAKFTQKDVKGPDGKPAHYAARTDGKTGALYIFGSLEADIIGVDGQEKYDGTKIADYFIDTQLRKKSETTRMATVIGKLGGTVPRKASLKEWGELFGKVLAGSPEGGIKTRWEASCRTCDDAQKAGTGAWAAGGPKAGERKQGEFLRGMHTFPQKAGVPDPNVQCPTCKTWCLAQVRIDRYLSLAELKAAQASPGKR